MTVHAMIDLETLGVRENCIILTLGAVKFDPCVPGSEPRDSMHLFPDIDEQSKIGRHADDDTMAWWSRQNERAREVAFSDSDRIPITEFIARLNRWCVGTDVFWAHGPIFDYAILRHLYEQQNFPCPWNYWQIRDSRTVYSMTTDQPVYGGDRHNAVDDAIAQAKRITEIFSRFSITEAS